MCVRVRARVSMHEHFTHFRNSRRVSGLESSEQGVEGKAEEPVHVVTWKPPWQGNIQGGLWLLCDTWTVVGHVRNPARVEARGQLGGYCNSEKRSYEGCLTQPLEICCSCNTE